MGATPPLRHVLGNMCDSQDHSSMRAHLSVNSNRLSCELPGKLGNLPPEAIHASVLMGTLSEVLMVADNYTELKSACRMYPISIRRILIIYVTRFFLKIHDQSKYQRNFEISIIILFS